MSIGLQFFNDLGGTIHIEMSEEPKQIGTLLNQRSVSSSKVLGVSWDPHVYIEDDTRELTSKELELIVFQDCSIKLRSYACLKPSKIVEHKAPNGKYFTVKDMIAVICEQERQTRGDTDWFGGIDIHHIFFEGLTPDKDVWIVSYGS